MKDARASFEYRVWMLADVLAILFAKVILIRVARVKAIVIRGHGSSRLGNDIPEYKTNEGADADYDKL